MKLQNLKNLTLALLVGMMASCSGGDEEPTIAYTLTVSATEGGVCHHSKECLYGRRGSIRNGYGK